MYLCVKIVANDNSKPIQVMQIYLKNSNQLMLYNI